MTVIQAPPARGEAESPAHQQSLGGAQVGRAARLCSQLPSTAPGRGPRVQDSCHRARWAVRRVSQTPGPQESQELERTLDSPWAWLWAFKSSFQLLSLCLRDPSTAPASHRPSETGHVEVACKQQHPGHQANIRIPFSPPRQREPRRLLAAAHECPRPTRMSRAPNSELH